MILEVASDIPTFKTVRLRRGLNLLVVKVKAGSTKGHSRNSAGKSSLVEIIHFILGADVAKSSLAMAPKIAGRSFSGVLRLRDRVIRVTRRCDGSKTVAMSRKHAARLGLLPRDEPAVLWAPDEAEVVEVGIEAWRHCLGHSWFGLPFDDAHTPFALQHAPTFRRLIGYFARKVGDGGFVHIDRTFGALRKSGDSQVALSYLLGLDWRIPRDMQDLRDRQKALAGLDRAFKDGELARQFGTSATIRPELARVEERLERLRRQIDTFEVLDTYRGQADEAARLKAEISALAIRRAAAQEAVRYLDVLMAEEKPPAYASVETLYKAAGVELPDVVLRSFEDVSRFQQSVVENRRTFLREQADEATKVIEETAERSREADRSRATILQDLQGKGALEDFVRLQEELGRTSSAFNTLTYNLKTANVLEGKNAEMKKDRASLELALRQDYEAKGAQIAAATRLVDAAIVALYDDRTGNLLIEPTADGPIFRLTIGGGGNRGGIDQMKVFCFDMMLLQRSGERLGGPRFLVHDSHLFDGVDVRQVDSALRLGAVVAGRIRGQYLVTLNSDKFESVARDDDLLRKAVLPVDINDDDENGGLFGFRFARLSQRT